MFNRAPQGRPRSEAFRSIQELVAEATDECQFFSFPVRTVAWGGTTKTPHWISTYLTHGPKPSPELVPVRVCGVRGCINGLHFKWGTMDEAQDARIFPSRRGGNNPMAKVSDLELAQLRRVSWGNGRFKAQSAEAAGVSVRTLNALLKGWSRGAVGTPIDAVTDTDEF